MKLYDDHYEEKIIIAALLHDLIEDTEVTFKEIVDGFGEEAGHLVSACSFDSSIMDPTERYKEANLRCKVSGKNALIIKSADFLDNLPYTLGRRGDNYEFLKAKTKHVIDQAAAVIADESIFKALLVSYKNFTTANNS